MKKLENRQAGARLTLRLPVSLHEGLKSEAAREGVPLNQYCLYILGRAVGQPQYIVVEGKKEKKPEGQKKKA